MTFQLIVVPSRNMSQNFQNLEAVQACGRWLRQTNAGKPFDPLEVLNRLPCKECGGHYADHSYLSEEDIWDARDQGCAVDICSTRENCPSGRTFFCHILPSPEDPCDDDFMRSIST